MELDWDDLRFVLAVSRAGSLRGAAEALGVNHATVSRHLSEITEDLGVRLFDRDGRSWVTTAAGADLVETALRMETEVHALSRRVTGRDVQLRGTVRVAIAASIVTPLASVFAKLIENYPEIKIELSTSLELVNLTKREADIAVRVTDTPPEVLVGREVAKFGAAAYGHHTLLDSVEPCAIDTYPWLAWDEQYRFFKPERWLREHVSDSRIRARADNEMTLFELCKAGIGVSFLPCFIGDPEPCLRRLSPELPMFHYGMWVLTHADARRTATVRSFLQPLADAIATRAPAFSGVPGP